MHRFLCPLAVLAWLLAPPGCAAQSQEQKAFDQYRECLRPFVQRLDDGVSDARSVAAAIMAMCRSLRLQYYQALSPVAGIEALSTAMLAQRDSDIDEVTALVLASRVQKKPAR